MRTMAIRIVFFFLWIAIAVKCKLTYIPLDCVRPVRACPINQASWTRMNDILECPAFLGYVCLRNFQGFLVETCMVNFTVEANTGKCPVLFDCVKGKPHLGPKSADYICPEEIEGCPQKHHGSYSIYKLYKYPRCLESNLTTSFGNMSENSTSTAETSSTTAGPEQNQEQENIPIVIPILIPIILMTALIILSGCFLIRRKKRRENQQTEETLPLQGQFEQHQTENPPAEENLPLQDDFEQHQEENPPAEENLPLQDEFEQHQKEKENKILEELRPSILYWNETQADLVQILPLNPDDTMEIDEFYTKVLINDESDKRDYKPNGKANIENISLDSIFFVQKEKHARFIFMLGEAGYGKTVQCQRITKSWCQAWKDENCQDPLVRRLKIFDCLFFVKLREARNSYTSLIDLILDAYRQYHPPQDCLNTIRTILEEGKCRSLVILDGLDEWNITDADKLLDKGIPNCRNMWNCTILMSMRSWKFIEVKQIRLHQMDKVVRLCGLDERGFEFITEKLLCRCLNMDKGSARFQDITKNIKNFISASSYAAQSLMKIPFLAVLCIHAFHDNVQSHCGHSMTTLYLSIIETLMERSKQYDEKSNDNESIYATLRDYTHLQNHRKDLSNLGKIAFSGLTSENKALIFKSSDLNKTFSEDVLQRYFKVGFLIKANAQGQLHARFFEISFLHKTIQEFLAAFYLWTDGNIDEHFLRKHVLDVEKALEFSMVLTFLSGLSSVDGCKISRHLKDLASTDEDIQSFRLHFASDSYEKVFHLYDLQLRCYREIRHPKNKKCFSEDDKLKFSFSDIILHGKDSDRQLIRDTADVLLEHPHDIESLQMKFIPDDEQNGISNDELKNFLDKSTSIKSVNIDGYVDGKCRVFSHFSQKMSSLITLGLHNIAIEGEILTDLFTRDTTKKFQALGLFYIRSSDDPNVGFEYKFPPGNTKPSRRSGYERKERMRALPTSDSHNNEDSGKPLLKDILRILPNFELLTTLHISYMESLEDRNILLAVAKELQIKGQLKNFGYQGCAMYNVVDDQHDTEIIKVIFTMNQLQYIFLSDIALNDKFPVFPEMLQLKKFSLEDISLNKIEWRKLAATLSDQNKYKKACPVDVVLTDTDIDDESLKEFEGAPGLSIKNDTYMI